MNKNIFILSLILLNFLLGETFVNSQSTSSAISITISIPAMQEWQPPALPNPSLPGGVISTCVIIVLTELSALGIVYALGKAFSYNKLITYSRGEFTQALANLVLVALISVTFTLTNIAGVISSLDTKIAQDSRQIWNYAFGTIAYNTIISSIMTITLSMQVTIPIPIVAGIEMDIILGLGDVALIEGLAPLLDAVDRIYSFFSASWIFLAATRVFLNFVGSDVFLTLLYLGLILRVIPWGRSAGGYLISLFLSFYFFYPLLLSFLLSLEPFQNIELQPFTNFDWIRSSASSADFIETLLKLLEGSIYAFANFAIKYLISILLCFIMALMLAEEIGSLLGSYVSMPSLFKLI